MSIVETLPDRPLNTGEWEKIKESDKVNDAIPFYGGLANASVFGEGLIPAFVIATDSSIISVIHNETEEDDGEASWKVKQKVSVDDVRGVDGKMAEMFSDFKEEFGAQTGLGK